jgi:hypothetical protein
VTLSLIISRKTHLPMSSIYNTVGIIVPSTSLRNVGMPGFGL